MNIGKDFWRNTGWSYTRFFKALLLVVVLPNILFCIIAEYFNLSRFYFNVDYLFASIFIVFSYRYIFILLFSAAFLFDSLGLVGQVFPIFYLSDTPYLLKFITVAPTNYKIVIFLILAIMVAFAYVIFRTIKKSYKLEIFVLINLTIYAYFISAQFSGRSNDQMWRIRQQSPIGSQVIFAYKSRNNAFVNLLFGKGRSFSTAESHGVTDPLFSTSTQEDILLIINESWGVTSRDIFDSVTAPLMTSERELIDIQSGELTFQGTTIEAELRELCQLRPSHFNFTGQEQIFSACLPNLMKQSGYKTYAFHGAAGLMYDRVKWYPQVGFDELKFFESNRWNRRCYSFPGVCDRDMANEIKQAFSTEENVFSYWLTLNTHATYDERDIYRDLFNCADFEIPRSTQTCRNLKLQSQFFYTLKLLIESPEMQGVKVIVVGDHEPPILDQVEKVKYFTPGKIPWLTFRVSKPNA